jgi:hypothetical protein
MDGAGVLYETKNPVRVAALMDSIVSNTQLQDEILRAQRAAVDRLRAKDFGGTLLKLVERVLSAPRCRPPRVAVDFWEDFDAARELEELRLYRPSVYKALPAKHA